MDIQIENTIYTQLNIPILPPGTFDMYLKQQPNLYQYVCNRLVMSDHIMGKLYTDLI